MSSYMQFLIIHLLSLAVVCIGGKAFAQTPDGRKLDSQILSVVDGWEANSKVSESIAQKYATVLAKFEGSADRPVLLQALNFIENNATKVANKSYLTLIDYSKSAETKRLYVIDLRNGEMQKYAVAAGKGSDPDHDGIATSFSNEPNSYKTSLGFYLTLEDYHSEKFDSKALRLAGLSVTNSNAEARAIVMHGAWYVDPTHGIYGRSEGCPALEKTVAADVISKIKDGSLILAYK